MGAPEVVRAWMVTVVAVQRRTQRLLRTIRLQLQDIEQKVDQLMTQNDEVRALLDTLGTDTASLRGSLTGVSADVTELKRLISELPTGEVLDPALVEELRAKVADVSAVTDGFAQLDEQTPGTVQG